MRRIIPFCFIGGQAEEVFFIQSIKSRIGELKRRTIRFYSSSKKLIAPIEAEHRVEEEWIARRTILDAKAAKAAARMKQEAVCFLAPCTTHEKLDRERWPRLVLAAVGVFA